MPSSVDPQIPPKAAVGFGFMVLENASYLISAAVEGPGEEGVAPKGQGHSEEQRATLSTGLEIFRMFTLLIRTIFNLHPWAAALTAARLARLMRKTGGGWPDRDFASCAFRECAWALWPSVLLHALYDLLVMILPPAPGILMPFVFVLVLRTMLSAEWCDAAPPREAQVVRVVDGPAPDEGQVASPGAVEGAQAPTDAPAARTPSDDPFLTGAVPERGPDGRPSSSPGA